MDRAPDAASDLSLDLGPDLVSPVDMACAVNAPCKLDGGSMGLCGAGRTCTTCAGPQDNNSCIRAYGPGTVCVNGQCAAASCQDSTECRSEGNTIRDTGTDTCRRCTDDSDCR